MAGQANQSTIDRRLAAIRALEIENRLSWLVNGVVLAMFGPALFLRLQYPEPLGAFVRYGGLAALVAVQVYRWRVRQPQRTVLGID